MLRRAYNVTCLLARRLLARARVEFESSVSPLCMTTHAPQTHDAAEPITTKGSATRRVGQSLKSRNGLFWPLPHVLLVSV